MKVLVTGGGGFLGGHLRRRLKAEGFEVYAPSRQELDLTSADAVSGALRGRSFDRIFHLAAWTQAGDFCLRRPGEQWLINQKINLNVVNWWVEEQPQAKMISIGTSCSYDPELPHTEENYLKGLPVESLLTYGYTKRMLQIGIEAATKQFGLSYLTLVPSTLYGSGYHLDGRQMHFIFDLIRKFLRFKFFKEPIVLWGDGYQRRELIYVDDFISQVIALDSTVSNEIVNLGGGAEYTIRDFALMLSELLEIDPACVQYDESRYVGARSKFLICKKRDQLLLNPQFTSLEAGLRSTINWFVETRAFEAQ